MPNQNSRKTHCKSGHPFKGDNLMISGGKRYCRICKYAYNREYSRNTNKENPGRQYTYLKKWLDSDKDRALAYWNTSRQNRRAKLAGAEGSYTHTEWLNLVKLYGGICAHCKEPTKPVTADHIVPLRS